MSLTEKNDLEKYFEWWLNELLDHGYIYGYDREAEKFELFPDYVANRLKMFKTKEPEIEQFNFMQKKHYNYDYNIRWAPKSQNIFFQEGDFSDPRNLETFSYRNVYFIASWNAEKRCHISYVDVKPPAVGAQGHQNVSFHTFPLKQAILLWVRGVYINKAIPFPMRGTGTTISLFPNTFTPRRYMMTDGGTRSRKIRFRIKSLDIYIKERKQELAEIEAKLKKIYDKQKPLGHQQKLL